MKKIILISLIILNSISCINKRDKRENVKEENKVDIVFKDVGGYEDIHNLPHLIASCKNSYSFDVLLEKFNSKDPQFNKQESIALLLGGLNHTGYKNEKLDSLERFSMELQKEGKIEKALTIADECLEIFPLSLRALTVKWLVYDELRKEELANVVYKKASVLFKAMRSLTFGSKDRLMVAYSFSATEDYANIYAGGAGLKFVERSKDAHGNDLIIYEGAHFSAKFIIPTKVFIEK